MIIRYSGEIGIKGAWTRRDFENHLLENIKNALTHHKIRYDRVARKYGRLYLKLSSAREASSRLYKVFGVSSISPAIETTSEMRDVVAKSLSLAGSAFREGGNSSAVGCRRVGK